MSTKTLPDASAGEQVDCVLDVGCGQGKLLDLLRDGGVPSIGLDASIDDAQICYRLACLRRRSNAPVPGTTRSVALRPCICSTISKTPFEAVAECHRVLRAGRHVRRVRSEQVRLTGIAVSPARLRSALDLRQRERPRNQLARYSRRIEIDAWDGPYVHLPDREALTLYLRGRRLSPSDAYSVADAVHTPLTLTKRGAIIYARKSV